MILWLASAHAAPCVPTTLAELAATPAPAVIVLGERRGTQPDLARAARLVARLRATGEPITVGLQAIGKDKQPVLDRYADGQVEPSDLPGLLDWTPTAAEKDPLGYAGFPYAAYERLVTGALYEDTVLAVGVPFRLLPDDATLPLPPAYGTLLADAMGEHPMPATLEGSFAQTMAWMDHRIARTAVEGWTGKGYLVLVVDRVHVEGGKGVGWQAQRLVEAPVTSVLLGGPGACYPDDRTL